MNTQCKCGWLIPTIFSLDILEADNCSEIKQAKLNIWCPVCHQELSQNLIKDKNNPIPTRADVQEWAGKKRNEILFSKN